MKTRIRKITTALLALTVALPSAAAQIPTLSTAAQPAAPAKAAPQPAAVTEETAAPAVTTGPAAEYAVNTGTCTTMPKAYAPIVTTTTTGFDDCSHYIYGTNNCVTGIWPDDSEITTTTTTATSGCDDYVQRLRHAFDPSKDHSRYTKKLSIGGTDTKTEYQIGEQLDPSQIYISASGMYKDGAGNDVNWDIFYTALKNMPNYEIDDSKFDCTKPGKYEITVYLPLDELPDADGCKGTFTVEVVAPADTTQRHSDIPNIELQSLPKTDYLIGEELDLSGAMLIWGEGPIQYDGKIWWGLPLDQYPELVDASRFDNTKPGTYRIYVNLHDSQSPGFDLQTYYDVTVSEGCVTTCTTDENWYDPGMGYIMFREIPKTVYQIGEELDLSGIMYDASGQTRAGGDATGVYWDCWNQPLDEAHYEVDDSEFDNTKPGTYTISILLHSFCASGSCLARGSFEVQVVAGTKGSDSQTTATVTTTTEDPWDDIMCEGTNHCNDAFWLDGAAEVFNYDGAPNSAERSISCRINDEIKIRLPYQSKNHKPMFDTNISVSLSEDIQDSYFEFTDTAIIWHGTVTAVGNHDVIFNIESETGIGWNHIDFIVYAFECGTSVTTETDTTTQPAETRPHYTGSEAFTTQLTFNETRKTVTIPYPQIKQQQNKPEYCVDVFDETGKCINNSVRFNKDSLVIKDVTEFFKEGAEKVLYLTVKSRTGSYTADYIIADEDYKGEYVPQRFLPETGDINGDSKVDVKDAVLLARVCAGDSSVKLTDTMQAKADVNGDTKVTSIDLTLMIRKLARLI